MNATLEWIQDTFSNVDAKLEIRSSILMQN